MQTPRALRTTELVKEFSKQGHQVTVYVVLGEYDYSAFEKEYNVKVKPVPVSFQKTPYSSDGVKKRALSDKVLGRLLGKVSMFPDIEFLFSVSKIIKKEEKFDVLISIANPHPIHWGCAKAKEKLPNKFPKTWIADCGDPFMKNGKTKDHFFYFEKYERAFCKAADYISVPTKLAREAYYEEYRDKIKVIPQGFNFNLNKENKIPKNKITTFAFTGTFLKDIRNPKLFLDYLVRRKDNFKFIIYTQHTTLIDAYRNILKEKIEIRNYISRNELLPILSEMDFLLNLENVNSPNQTPSKLIDYAITNRPILSINPNNLAIDKIDAFFNKNYSKKLIIEDLNQYHISNVVNKFLNLVN